MYGMMLRIVLFLLVAAGCAFSGELHDFTSDGCSLFPDGNFKDRTLWCDCCFDHDIAYWQGGTKEERMRADEALRDCVRERTLDKELANVMFLGVRGGGHPAFPTWYRWGYGWKYGKGYAPLTEQEKQQVSNRLEAYHAKQSSGYCGEKRRQRIKEGGLSPEHK